MIKRLSKIGNSHGLIIEKSIMDLLQWDPAQSLEIQTDGSRLIIGRVEKSEGWVGIDLDRTLAEYYSGWFKEHGPLHIGPPIPAMVRTFHELKLRGKRVKIFTARAMSLDIEEQMMIIKAIQQWCLQHLGEVLPITNIKDYDCEMIIDDRARQAVGNKGTIVGCHLCGGTNIL